MRALAARPGGLHGVLHNLTDLPLSRRSERWSSTGTGSCGESQSSATGRSCEFGELAYPFARRRLHPALIGLPFGRWAPGVGLLPAGVRPRSGRAALGFSEADTAILCEHFLDAESRGKLGHGLSRIDWLETLRPEPERAAAAAPRRARLRALGRQRRARLPDARGRLRRAGSSTRRDMRGSWWHRTASRRGRSAGTRSGWRKAVSSRR